MSTRYTGNLRHANIGNGIYADFIGVSQLPNCKDADVYFIGDNPSVLPYWRNSLVYTEANRRAFAKLAVAVDHKFGDCHEAASFLRDSDLDISISQWMHI